MKRRLLRELRELIAVMIIVGGGFIGWLIVSSN